MTSEHPDIRSAREGDIKRRLFKCLRCGEEIWTDRCHRICLKCTRHNRISQEGSGLKPVDVSLDDIREHQEGFEGDF